MSGITIVTDDIDILQFTVINCRVLNVIASSAVEEIKVDNELSELIFTNGIKISIGSEVNVKNEFYKVQSIKKAKPEDGVTGYLLYTSVLNKTSMFILPMIGHDRAKFKWNSSFMNSFVEVEDSPNDLGDIYLWYRYLPSVDMEAFEDFIVSLPTYVDMSDIDKHHVLYKLSVPEAYLPDYKLIIEGKYSQISEITKKRILDFHSSTKERPLGKILYKTEARKKELEKQLGVELDDDAELHDLFYEKDETFYNKYIINNTGLTPDTSFE